MWTQWGAKARAAEYDAAKNAAARRTSEEHKLPQKPAPVSLSAFTKNAPLNRNKGIKAWKPLVLEDTPEATSDNESQEDIHGTPSTPTRFTSTENSNSVSEDNDVSRVLAKAAELGASDSTSSSIVAPASTAPRAMVSMPCQTPSALVNPTPKRVQPHSIIKQVQQTTTPSVHSSPGNVAAGGGYPNPNPYPWVEWHYGSHGFPVAVPFTVSTAPTLGPLAVQYAGNIMVPDDISPTKQETKLAFLSQQFAGPPPSFVARHDQFTAASGGIGTSGLPPMSAIHPGQAASHYPGAMFPTNPTGRPLLQHVSSDSVVDIEGSFSGSASCNIPNIVRHYSYPDTLAAPLEQPRATEQTTGVTAPHPARGPTLHSCEEEPYDRKTKMQSFVAAQQALAKTGKTVLHNPDLHQVRTTEATSPARSGSTATTPEHGLRRQILNPGSVTILKPPPGFGAQQSPRPTWEEDSNKKSCPIDQATLRQIFEVDERDWFELKPVTKAQRTKMNRVMNTFARAQAPDQTREFGPKLHEDKKENLWRWMQLANKDNRPVTATHKLFEEAARERLSTGAVGLDSDGATTNQLSQAEIECAAICAVGEIVANLIDDGGSSGANTDTDGLFAKWKPAPEYAIQRGRLLMGNSGSMSFFEDNAAGFYTAPSRIARDPRFRPAGKETIQVKADDGWKLRADMYGRRRL
ncbi:hypothetical protein G647_04944 [Cladophialophora carrionii CBS 160.54]|uniref:Uncharacterized protein n=1 Tax=Cladophialophora carrionii CBS 160.54 TaxID=1279043 RepID=V9DAZ8_9EURO|nr:uncharacterized protein G647_04944 [Cladophialophora carrionii CBS 160.54]ETI23147.1 hypothetical protein G647_04944 [Cladophialophora carrionii CBS 160.54]